MTAVEGLGAVPVPVDWAEVPTALATGKVNGQENPVNVVLSSKLYETQSHMMLTSHIMNAQVIVINEKAWQKPDAAATRQAHEGCRRSARQGHRHRARARKPRNRQAQGAEDDGHRPAGRPEARRVQGERQQGREAKFAAKYGDLYKEIAAVR